MKTNFNHLPRALMQNDFLSSLPSIADQLGYASNDLWSFISDCDDERDPYDSGMLFTASNALRSHGFGCTLSIGQLTKWMRYQGVTFDTLIERGVAPELVEILQEVCGHCSHIDVRDLYSGSRNRRVHVSETY